MPEAFSHDFFPIAVGNEWDYRSSVLKIASDTVVSGKHVFVLEIKSSDTGILKETFYLYSDGADIYVNTGPFADGWKMYFAKHSFKDNQTWEGTTGNGGVDTFTANYKDMVGLFDSCYTVRVGNADQAFVFANDVGLIIIGGDVITDFHLNNISTVRRKNFRLLPANGNEVRLSDHLVTKMFTLNGRLVHTFTATNSGVGFYLLSYPDSRCVNKKYAGKVILNR